MTLNPTASQTTAQTVFSQPFEIKANRNVRITANAPVNNSWADLDVDLINEQNNEVESVNIPVEYYSGVEDGESWSEGGQSQDATLSSLPAGNYTLRVEGTWQNFQQPMPVAVKVEQNVMRGVNFWLSFILLSILPLWSLFRKITFESRRWSESMFGKQSVNEYGVFNAKIVNDKKNALHNFRDEHYSFLSGFVVVRLGNCQFGKQFEAWNSVYLWRIFVEENKC